MRFAFPAGRLRESGKLSAKAAMMLGAIGSPGPGPWLEPYAGYLHLIPRMVGSLAVRFPLVDAVPADADVGLKLERPRNAEHGDYAVNVSSLARYAKAAPPQIAETLAPFLEKQGLEVSTIAGFINFKLSDDLFLASLQDLLKTDQPGKNDTRAAERILLSKEMVTLYEDVQEFWVAEEPTGAIIGCGALHVMWEDLAEVRTLATDPRWRSLGDVGRRDDRGPRDRPVRRGGAQAVRSGAQSPQWLPSMRHSCGVALISVAPCTGARSTTAAGLLPGLSALRILRPQRLASVRCTLVLLCGHEVRRCIRAATPSAAVPLLASLSTE